MLKQTVRTTVTLPEQLLKAVDEAVEGGKAKNRNDFIATALQHELATLKRLEIDSAFEYMSADSQYRQEAQKLSKEFAESDWEAFREGERRG